MTMKELQKKLARAARDWDAIAADLYERRFPYDYEKAEQALAITGQLCQAFLDEAEVEKLDELMGDISRPEPGTTGIPSADKLDEFERLAMERVLKMNKKTRVVKRTVTTASGKRSVMDTKFCANLC